MAILTAINAGGGGRTITHPTTLSDLITQASLADYGDLITIGEIGVVSGSYIPTAHYVSMHKISASSTMIYFSATGYINSSNDNKNYPICNASINTSTNKLSIFYTMSGTTTSQSYNATDTLRSFNDISVVKFS